MQKLKKKVFTNGCFDIIHAGHIDFFEKAKSMGTELIVAVNSDASVRGIKGLKRPIINLEHRLKVLSSIKYIDMLLVFEEDTPLNLIKQVRPDILVKGRDWETKGGIVGEDFVKSYGGCVTYIDLLPDLSTSIIIERILDGYRG